MRDEFGIWYGIWVMVDGILEGIKRPFLPTKLRIIFALFFRRNSYHLLRTSNQVLQTLKGQHLQRPEASNLFVISGQNFMFLTYN